ncbi:MAG TPA: hypothetical protein VGU43_04545 [Thermoplasmata archaeon]|nr:hypothetical protein [Thermoplasmata archaeon]
MARTFHFALAAIVLGLTSIGLAFGLGFFAPGWFASPSQATEIILVVGVIATFILFLAAIAVEGKDGRASRAVGHPIFGLPSRGLRRNFRGVDGWRGHHVGWLVISLFFLVLVSAGAYAWAVVYEGADLVSAGVIAFLIFLLTALVVAIVFAAMKTKKWVASHRR